MKTILLLIFLLLAATLQSAAAQTSTDEAVKAYVDAKKAYSNATLELQRIDLRAKKRELIKKAVALSEEQAKNFWPVYDKYEKELVQINDTRLAMITDYAKNYESMTDEKAAELIVRAMDFQDKRMGLRKSYMADLRNILPPKMVARLLQLENQTDLLIDLEIASQVPLVK
jgi:hypothetical protein